MTKPNDGGPAFARPGFTAEQTESQEGMSLRDWFAGQFAAAQIQRGHLTLGVLRSELIISEKSARECASIAYQMADAMLAAREKGMTNE